MKKNFVAVLLIVVCSPLFSEVLVDKVAAVVNSEIIMKSDLDVIVAQQMEMYKSVIKPEEAAELPNNILNQMIQEKLLSQEAKKMNIDITKSEIENRYSDTEKRAGGEEKLKEALNMQGMTVEKYKESIGENLAVQKMINDEVRRKIKVELSEILKYYETNANKFRKKSRAMVRHILVTAGKDRTDAKAREVMDTVMEKLKNGGNFAELAKNYSDEPSKENGGFLSEDGYVNAGDFQADLDKAIFSTKEGGLSEVVKNEKGLHLFKVEKIEEGITLKLDDEAPYYAASALGSQGEKLNIREVVRRMLYQDKFNAELEKFMGKLKEKSIIEIKLGGNAK